MLSTTLNSDKNILVVARWPLGGIRTYMRYVFSHFPQDYHLTLIVPSTHEDNALADDVKNYSARLVIVQKKGLILGIIKEMRTVHYDVVLSQGFISALFVFFPNKYFRLPHILTIHGIVEPKYLSGRFGWAKRLLLEKILSDATILYGVSNDILTHIYEQFPSLNHSKAKSVVIPNGIEMSDFEVSNISHNTIRTRFDINETTFLFGFFGRFMPQKGFDLLIDAIDILREKNKNKSFVVLAVGSGDYLSSYQKTIQQRNLDQFFVFLPFQPQIKEIYLEVDTIVMPSRWEASGLQAMEALSLGVPFVAANCIGLRETISDSPAFVFESENVMSLAETLQNCMDTTCRDRFKDYILTARERFDVSSTSRQLVQIINDISSTRH